MQITKRNTMLAAVVGSALFVAPFIGSNLEKVNVKAFADQITQTSKLTVANPDKIKNNKDANLKSIYNNSVDKSRQDSIDEVVQKPAPAPTPTPEPAKPAVQQVPAVEQAKATPAPVVAQQTQGMNSNVVNAAISTSDPHQAFSQLCQQYGLSQSDIDAWSFIIGKESGWRINAQNPSGAYGLPQALPGAKMAAVDSDWATNPVTQLKYMYSYMNSRYGSIQGAYQFWISHNWY